MTRRDGPTPATARALDPMGSVLTSLRIAGIGALLAIGPAVFAQAHLGPARLAVATAGSLGVLAATAAALGVLLAPVYQSLAHRRNTMALVGIAHMVVTFAAATAVLFALRGDAGRIGAPLTGTDLFLRWVTVYAGLVLVVLSGIVLGLAQRIRVVGPMPRATPAARPQNPRTRAAWLGALWATPFAVIIATFLFLMTVIYLRDDAAAAVRGIGLTLLAPTATVVTYAAAAALLSDVFRTRTAAWSLLAGGGIAVLAAAAAPLTATLALWVTAPPAAGPTTVEGVGRTFVGALLPVGFGLGPILAIGFVSGIHLRLALRGTEPEPAG